jgi:hypothetical protein
MKSMLYDILDFNIACELKQSFINRLALAPLHHQLTDRKN